MLVILQPPLPIAFVLALGYLPCPQPQSCHIRGYTVCHPQGGSPSTELEGEEPESPVVTLSLNCLSGIGDELGGKTQAEVLLALLDA